MLRRARPWPRSKRAFQGDLDAPRTAGESCLADPCDAAAFFSSADAGVLQGLAKFVVAQNDVITEKTLGQQVSSRYPHVLCRPS